MSRTYIPPRATETLTVGPVAPALPDSKGSLVSRKLMPLQGPAICFDVTRSSYAITTARECRDVPIPHSFEGGQKMKDAVEE